MPDLDLTLQTALVIGQRMHDAILGLGCSAKPPFPNDEMGEAGKEAWEWELFMETYEKVAAEHKGDNE